MSSAAATEENAEENASAGPGKLKLFLGSAAVKVRAAFATAASAGKSVAGYFFPFTKDHARKLGYAVAANGLLALGIFGWLYLNAESTLSARVAAVPKIETALISTQPKVAAEPVETPALPGEAEAIAGQRQALSPAPFPWLIEERPDGLMLPVISQDGTLPWKAYARPFAATETRPRIAVVMTGLGLDKKATEDAITRLPGEISLAFSPYSDQLKFWLEQSRNQGHEVLMQLPLQPRSYPYDDPGPLAQLTRLSDSENAARLDQLMGKAPGYIGFITTMGSQIKTEYQRLRPLVETLKRRGLLLYNPEITEGDQLGTAAQDIALTFMQGGIKIDGEPQPALIDEQLQKALEQAKSTGSAIVYAEPYPATVDRLRSWIESMDGSVALAPLSALAPQ